MYYKSIALSKHSLFYKEKILTDKGRFNMLSIQWEEILYTAVIMVGIPRNWPSFHTYLWFTRLLTLLISYQAINTN